MHIIRVIKLLACAIGILVNTLHCNRSHTHHAMAKKFKALRASAAVPSMAIIITISYNAM